MMTIVGAPLTTKLAALIPGLHGQAAIAPLVLVLTLAAANAIAGSARSRATSIFLGGLVVAVLCLSTLFRHDSLAAVNLVAQMAFLTYVIFVVVRVVFRASLVDGNILCGAASLYLMIGVLIGFIYSLIELLNPGSFVIIQPVGAACAEPRRGAPGMADLLQPDHADHGQHGRHAPFHRSCPEHGRPRSGHRADIDRSHDGPACRLARRAGQLRARQAGRF